MPAGNPQAALPFVLFTVFMNMMGLGLVVPVIPELMNDIGGLTVSDASLVAGWLLVAYAGMQFIFAPVMGNLSDRYGRRPILIISMAGLAIDYLIMALTPTFFLLFVGRLLAGMFGATMPAANAAMADISTPQTRAKNFGLVGAAGAAGLVFGPGIGGLLGEVGVRLPFFAAAAVSAIAAVYGYFFLKETLTPEHQRPFEWRRANPISSFSKVAGQPVVITTLAALFCFQLAAQCMPATWPFYTIEKYGWSKTAIGISISAYAIALVCVQGFLTGPVTKRLGAARAGIFSLVVLLFSYIGFAFAPTTIVLCVWIAFAALHGFAFPAMQTLMTRRMGDNVQGELQGAVGSTMGLTAILGPLLMSQAFGRFTDGAGIYFAGAAFILGAGLLIISIGLLMRALQQDHRHPMPDINGMHQERA